MKTTLARALIVASVAALAVPMQDAGALAPLVTRHRSGASVAPGLVALGRTPPAEAVDVTLFLVQPGADALQRYVSEQRRSAAPVWLTPPEIGERFGLPTARIDAVVARLSARGLQVTERYEQRTTLEARGPARAVERLFHIQLLDFRAADGTRVRVPSARPRIPADLVDAVSQVAGLDTRPRYAPRVVPRVGARSGGWLSPTDLDNAYGGGALRKAGWDGKGETVAILSLANPHGEEFGAWAKRFGTNTQPTEQRLVKPAPPKPGQKHWSKAQAGEVALDLEMVRAMAPAATVLNYTTRNDDGSIERIVGRVQHDQAASILTISWGECEADYTPDDLTAREGVYASAAAAGIDIFVASGDFGPYDCNDWNNMSDRHVVVDYPATSANVIAVGGTTLYQQDGVTHEDAWQEPQSIVGSGGGTSTVVSRPPWQLDSVVARTGSNRVVPDVAGPASNFTNLLTAEWEGSKGVQFGIPSGTSAAAPFWAGATAVVKQYLRQTVGRAPDGKLAAVLYQLASRPDTYAKVFHDVTAGGNDHYSASPGWDQVTGLGSPNISNLALAWQTLLTGR